MSPYNLYPIEQHKSRTRPESIIQLLLGHLVNSFLETKFNVFSQFYSDPTYPTLAFIPFPLTLSTKNQYSTLTSKLAHKHLPTQSSSATAFSSSAVPNTSRSSKHSSSSQTATSPTKLEIKITIKKSHPSSTRHCKFI